jgi:predicted nucleotide-binding protein
MKKSKTYLDVKFSPEVVSEAAKILDTLLEEQNGKWFRGIRSVKLTEIETWDYDTDEEFFSDYRREHIHSDYSKFSNDLSLTITFGSKFSFGLGRLGSDVYVEAKDRKTIEAAFEVFERNAERCKLPPLPPEPTPNKPKPQIFIGHGGNTQWRDLKDHLHEKHKYEVTSYETGARAGHEIRDILEEMLSKASFAVLVMTGEDEAGDGKMRARQNVVHELGLFQGHLGFPRAIVLLEDGTEEFSNLAGVQQIRYAKGNIKETFGDVLATLKREFAD